LSVQPDRFTAYVHEPPNLDVWHTAETVSYLVVEAGSWRLAGGTLLEAGSEVTSATVGRLIDKTWRTVSFGTPFDQSPVILTQVQGDADPHWVKTRRHLLSPTGFTFGMEEEEAKTTTHGTETVGWLAIEAGAGSWSGIAYQAAALGGVTDTWATATFAGGMGSSPRLLANLASYLGADNSHARYRDLGSTSVRFKVEEDTTYDPDIIHYQQEVIDYLVFGGDGVLEAAPQAP
jgi:serralysin